jgi:hypothetical protein
VLPKVTDDIQDAVKTLRTRMGELEEQLERMRLRVASLERTLSSVVQMDFQAFGLAAREVYDQLNGSQRGFVGVVSISDLRRAMGARISRQAFDEHLVRLHDEGTVQLMPHRSPSEERQKEGLVHPTHGAFFYVRWERRS